MLFAHIDAHTQGHEPWHSSCPGAGTLGTQAELQQAPDYSDPQGRSATAEAFHEGHVSESPSWLDVGIGHSVQGTSSWVHVGMMRAGMIAGMAEHLHVGAGKNAKGIAKDLLAGRHAEQPIHDTSQHLAAQLGACREAVLGRHVLQQHPDTHASDIINRIHMISMASCEAS